MVDQPGGQRPQLAAVIVDDPKVRSRPVIHDVHEITNEDNLVAAGRDLWVIHKLEIKDVAGFEAVCGLERCPKSQ